MASDDYWSIDFLGVDNEKAALIVEEVKRLGLATSAIVADPDSFLTLHLDAETAASLDAALATSLPAEHYSRTVDSVRESIHHWASVKENG